MKILEEYDWFHFQFIGTIFSKQLVNNEKWCQHTSEYGSEIEENKVMGDPSWNTYKYPWL